MIDVGDREIFAGRKAASAVGLSCQQGHYPRNGVEGQWRGECTLDVGEVGCGRGGEEKGRVNRDKRKNVGAEWKRTGDENSEGMTETESKGGERDRDREPLRALQLWRAGGLCTAK